MDHVRARLVQRSSSAAVAARGAPRGVRLLHHPNRPHLRRSRQASSARWRRPRSPTCKRRRLTRRPRVVARPPRRLGSRPRCSPVNAAAPVQLSRPRGRCWARSRRGRAQTPRCRKVTYALAERLPRRAAAPRAASSSRARLLAAPPRRPPASSRRVSGPCAPGGPLAPRRGGASARRARSGRRRRPMRSPVGPRLAARAGRAAARLRNAAEGGPPRTGSREISAAGRRTEAGRAMGSYIYGCPRGPWHRGLARSPLRFSLPQRAPKAYRAPWRRRWRS